MICQSCMELRLDDALKACRECGSTLVPINASKFDLLVQAKLRRRIEGWRTSGTLDEATAARLLASLSETPSEPSPAPTPAPVRSEAEEMEQRADAIAASVERIQQWRPGWGSALARALEDAAKAEREAEAAQRASEPRRRKRLRRGAASGEDDGGEEDLGLAAQSGQALFGGAGAVGGGLEAMVALDSGDARGRSDIQSLLHEYIWWFLGALMVLGGSIMGVREAWRALGGVPRQLIVSGALLAYHGGFIGLGAFLSRRSLSAGRVLAGIGLALLPVVFVALSSLMVLAPGVGAAAALLASGLCLVTLKPAGRLFGASVTSLALALLPSLWAGLPLMGLEASPWPRTLCMLAGVAAVGVSLWRSREAAGSLAVPGAALYGALALALFSVSSGAGGVEALDPGSPELAGLLLWSVALAAVVGGAATQPSAREAWPRVAPTVETLAHALVAGGAIVGAVSGFSVVPGMNAHVDVASALTPAAAALVFILLEPRRHALVHPAVVAATLSAVMLSRLAMPAQPAWWAAGGAAVPSGLLLLAKLCRPGFLRTWLVAWGVLLGVVSLPVVAIVAAASEPANPWPQVVTGALLALSAHLVAGLRWRALHYLGGVAAVFAALSFVAVSPLLQGSWSAGAVFALAGALYGGTGLLYGVWASRLENDRTFLPLDDLSLAAASLGVLFGLDGSMALPLLLRDGTGALEVVLRCAPTAFLTALLLLRLRRDRSRLVGFLAASGLALVVAQYFGARVLGGGVWDAVVLAALVLGFATVAVLRGPVPAKPESIPRGRQMIGAIRLPFAASGWPLFTDGFAAAALVQAVLVTVGLVGWLPTPNEAERSLVVLTGGLLVAASVLAFFSRGFVAWRLRGSVGTLAVAGLLIALTAVLNRVGRPLPPDVVAWRLPLIGIGLWVAALGMRRIGPWLARRLENPSHGGLYEFVPHAGVAALGALLAVDAVLVGWPDPARALTVVPPLMPLGAALLALLLSASFRAVFIARWGLMLGLPGAALWAAQRSLLGPALVAMEPPGGRWVRVEALEASRALGWLQPQAWLPAGETVALLAQRAFAGIAAAGLVYAVGALVLSLGGARFAWLQRFLDPKGGIYREGLVGMLRGVTIFATVLVFLSALLLPGLPAAELTFATGVVLLLGGAKSEGRGVVGVGLLLLVHAVAHLRPVFAPWPGPVLALIGFALVALHPWVARWRKLDEGSTRPRAHAAARTFSWIAVVYALATGSQTDSTWAVPQLLLGALDGVGGGWMLSVALPVTLAIIAARRLLGAFQWHGALARLHAAWGTFHAGAAALTGVAVWFVTHTNGSWEPRWPHLTLLGRHGVALALTASVTAAVAHAASLLVRTRREDVAGGLGFGRDLWLLGCGGGLALSAWLLRVPGEGVLPWALAALGLAVAVSLHCAWREQSGRHVYFVQVALVGAYALVRALSAADLRPEHDALFALALGFVLVGVTVLARRAGVPPVEEATRRFAALLPLGIALVLPAEATEQAAMFAGGSGLLYAALGAVEQSRLFGSFAAAACNLALLIAALAFGLEGIEIYLAPLGLLLLMLGQLFASSLPRAARTAVRILGGVLLYLPAAGKLALQVGGAEDGTYAVVFGGACLLGVMAGMVLQIRAYLALGTLFLTLDVVANLVHAGLRDHRVGFVVMTLTGLTIVGGRVLATLKKQEMELMLQRVRVQLRGWD